MLLRSDAFHKYFRIWILSILLAAMCMGVPAAAQSTDDTFCAVDVRQFGLNSGLYHHVVRDIFQDSRGIIWLASDVGLNAYDGFAMHKVYEWPVNPLRSSFALRMEDRQGRLWIFFENDDELPFLLVNIRTWEVVLPDAALDGARLGKVVDVTLDQEGLLRIINEKREVWRQNKDNEWERLFILPTRNHWRFCLPGAPDFSAAFLMKAQMGGNNSDSILLFSDAGQRIGAAEIPYFNSAVYQPTTRRMIVVGADRILEVDSSGHFKMEKIISAFPSLQAGDSMIETRVVADVRRGGFWRYQTGQLSWLLKGKGQPQVAVLPTLMPFNLAGIMDMMTDVQGNLWISTFEGLKKVRYIPDYFKRINWLNPLIDPLYFRNSSRGMAEDASGNVYIQSGGATYKLNPATWQQEVIYRSSKKFSAVVYDAVDNAVWMCLNKLVRYEVDGGRITEIDLPQQVRDQDTWAIFSRPGQIVFASSGLWVYDKKTGTIRPFAKYNGFSDLAKATVYHIDPINDREAWLYSNLGVYLLDWQQGIQAHYGSMQQGTYYLPAIHFHHGFRDDQATHWLASRQGLLRWNKAGNQYKLYTIKDGLPSNTIYAVYPDKKGKLWLSSDYGLIQFDPATETKRIFTTEDGITHNEFNRISHLKTSRGFLFFGGLNGVTAFHPDQFYQQEQTDAIGYKSLILMSAQVGSEVNTNRNILPDYYKDRRIIMKPGDQYVRLQFALPDFSKSENISYNYRIGGTDEAWVQTKTPVIQLLGLGYGTNILQIYAVSGDGSYRSEMLELPIVVRLPFYLSPVFLLGLLVALVLAIRGGLQFRLRQARKRQLELEQEVERRTARINEDKLLIEKQAKELEYINRQKTLFFSNVTHEFRTPLALVMSPVRLLMGSRKLSRRELGLLSIAKKNAARLLDMVEDILMLTTLETHNIKQREEVTEPLVFVEMLLQEYQSLASQKSLTLSSELKATADVQTVMLDCRLFRIIINNLLSNAIKFTPAGGHVHVLMEQSAGGIRLAIADTGRGIRAADIHKIFERFFQTSDSNAPAEGGTGIGLALVRELTEMLGGTIQVDSTEGVGSTFRVDLPVRVASPQDVASVSLPIRQGRDEKDMQPSYQRTGHSILIVEDNYDFQEYLEYLLGDSYEIRQMYNGQAALDTLNAGFRPSLIITDWMMPVMDGFQLKASLLKKRETASLPVLMLTARAADNDKMQALRLGIDDYLVKPFDEHSLLATVETLIGRHEMRRSDESVSLNQEKKPENEFQAEQAWLQQLMHETNQRLSKETFSVDELAAAMLMGRTSFFKETKRLTGLSPNQYILEARLVRARYLMETQSNLNLKKVIQLVGLKHESHFVKVFKKRFGHPPSHYL